MADGTGPRAWARRHSELLDLGAGVAAALAVLGMSLIQWGVTDAGWTRGVTLGATLGLVVTLAVRRGRAREEQRTREAAEQRLQLARELHDAVASQVSIIGIQAAAGRRVLEREPDAAARALDAIEASARAANVDLRRMLGTLRPESAVTAAASGPGLRDLPALVDEFRATGLTVHVSGLDAIPPLPPTLDAAAYRIVQEALANVVAHAGRVNTSLEVTPTGNGIRLIVENEAGHPLTAHRGSGLGLQGMRERAELVGGSVRAGTREGGGFVMEATLPVPPP